MKQTAGCLDKKTTHFAAFLKEQAACSGRRAACTCTQKEGRAAKRVPLAPASGKPGDRKAAGGQFHIFDKMFAKFVDFCRDFRENGSVDIAYFGETAR